LEQITAKIDTNVESRNILEQHTPVAKTLKTNRDPNYMMYEDNDIYKKESSLNLA
jgi:hypothetical protein